VVDEGAGIGGQEVGVRCHGDPRNRVLRVRAAPPFFALFESVIAMCAL
jgi:hypothetical protein